MFDFDVVSGPSDLAKHERSEVRRPPAPPRNPPAPQEPPSASAPVGSGVVADEAGGYSGGGLA